MLPTSQRHDPLFMVAIVHIELLDCVNLQLGHASSSIPVVTQQSQKLDWIFKFERVLLPNQSNKQGLLLKKKKKGHRSGKAAFDSTITRVLIKLI